MKLCKICANRDVTATAVRGDNMDDETVHIDHFCESCNPVKGCPEQVMCYACETYVDASKANLWIHRGNAHEVAFMCKTCGSPNMTQSEIEEIYGGVGWPKDPDGAYEEGPYYKADPYDHYFY